MTTLKLPKKDNIPQKTNYVVSGARARVKAQFNVNQIVKNDNTVVNNNKDNIPYHTYNEKTNTNNKNYNPYNSKNNLDNKERPLTERGGITHRDAANRRVEQKYAKLARQTHTPVFIQDDINAPQTFFASCPRGLEWALVQELESLHLNIIKRVASGALIQATWTQIAHANINSRIASRFLWQLSVQTIRGEDDIYEQASRIPWEKFFQWRDTIKVDTVGIKAEVRSLEFVTLRVKDAICDRFRKIDGNRPSVDTAMPNMRIMCVLEGVLSQIYLDTSGEPLFKRGWRGGEHSKGEAALKENLAAGLLALTQWKGDVPLYDPMCGSGTLIIEAAQKVFNIPAGLDRATRKAFAMQRFWHVRLPNQAYNLEDNTNNNINTINHIPSIKPLLFASDIHPEMVNIAAHNIQLAGLSGDTVQLACLDVLNIMPPTQEAGFLILNPPYGQRLGFNQTAGEDIEADAFYDAFATQLKRHFKGWTVWLLTSDEKVQARMRLKPNETHQVFNGAIPCRWLKFNIT